MSFTIINPNVFLSKITNQPIKKVFTQIFEYSIKPKSLLNSDLQGFFGDDEFKPNQKTFKVKIWNSFFIQYNQNILNKIAKLNYVVEAKKTTDRIIKISLEMMVNNKTEKINLNIEKTDKKAVSAAGGVNTEVMSEGFFCIYLAMKLKSSGDKQFDDWSRELIRKLSSAPANKGAKASLSDPQEILSTFLQNKGIEPLVKRQLEDEKFTAKKNDWKNFLVDQKWNEKYKIMCKKFVSSSKITGTNYTMMRTDKLEDSYNPYLLYNTFAEKMKKDLGFDKKLGDDKWNPADMWILSPKGKKILTDFHNEIKKTKTITVTDMNKLNLKIMNAYNTKDIFPVSLKAPAGNTVNYSLINYTANNKNLQIVETFKFRGLDEMKRMFTGNLLNNRDVKIPFVHEIKQGTIKNTVSKGNIKLKTGNSGGYRLEIEYEKGGAKGGSIGTENWQFLISKINRTGVNKVIDSRKEASTNIPKFGTQPIWDKKGVLREGGASQDTNWFGGLIYKKLTVENQKKLIHLLNVLLSKIDSNVKISPTQAKNLSSTYIFDKTSASELAVSIIHSKPGKVGENIRNAIAESLFDLASSRKFAYKQFDSAGKAKLTTLMNSCFHIKLY